MGAIKLIMLVARLRSAMKRPSSATTSENIKPNKMMLEFIPANPFLDMTGARKTSTIAVVIFSIFIGLSATGIARKKPEIFASFSHFVAVAHAIVMRMVTLVLRLTPFGVLALKRSARVS